MRVFPQRKVTIVSNKVNERQINTELGEKPVIPEVYKHEEYVILFLCTTC